MMTRKQFITIIATVLFILSGCKGDKSFESSLERGFVLSEKNPRIANIIVDSLSAFADRQSEKNRMLFRLLSIKVSDKNDRLEPMKALVSLDSLKEYFNGYDDVIIEGEVYYYSGRSKSEINDYKGALDDFHKALDIISDKEGAENTRGRIYSQMADVYTRLGEYTKCLELDRKALNEAIKENDILKIIDKQCDVASSLIILKRINESTVILNKCLEEAEQSGNQRLRQQIRLQLARSLFLQNKLDSAETIWTGLYKEGFFISDRSPAYSIGAHIFIARNDIDKAIPLLEWLADSGTMHAKKFALHNLANIDINSGNHESAILFHTKEKELSDSLLETQKRINTSHNIEYIVGNSDKIREIAQLRIRTFVCVSISLGVLVIILLAYIIFMKRKRGVIPDEFSTETFSANLSHTPCSIDNQLIKENTILEKNVEGDGSKEYDKGVENNNPDSLIRVLENKLMRNDYAFTDADWKNLDDYFKLSSPEFYKKFRDEFALRNDDWKITMLIRLNINPSIIGAVMETSAQNISNIRRRLYRQYYSPNGNAKDWDREVRRSLF